MKTNKLAFIIVLMTCLVAASSALAIQAGDLYGTGSGSCSKSGVTIYPWHTFTGHHSTGSISGSWTDNSYNGTFSGTVIEDDQDCDTAYGDWDCISGGSTICYGSFDIAFSNEYFIGGGGSWLCRTFYGTWTVDDTTWTPSPTFKSINGVEYVRYIGGGR